jgi:Fe-S-cluster containining protein
MNYYKKLLTEISVPESAVDCAKCTDMYKCCTYRPFIANFLAGGIGDKLETFDLREWDFTICGLSPNLNYRKQFKGKSGWGFGTDATLLCSFYNQKTGGCNVWENRPGVCRTFFCKSSYYDEGQTYWKSAEEVTWQLEWILAEDFLHHKGWTFDEIAEVKAYLHESAVEKKAKLPMAATFSSVMEAISFYKQAQQYVMDLKTEDVEELLGRSGLVKQEQVLAQKTKLR